MSAPYGRITTSIIRHLINDCMEKAGIEAGLRKHGPHAFRSSLASHMIDDNNSYDIVRKILGQADPNVIKHYAKTDIERFDYVLYHRRNQVVCLRTTFPERR